MRHSELTVGCHYRPGLGRIAWFLLLCLGLPILGRAQFTTSINDGCVTIEKYTGRDRDVRVPTSMNGLPVTQIGFGAFSGCPDLISVAIPNTVTNIGQVAFSDCINLNEISVDPLNGTYSSEDGVLFNKNKTVLIEFPGGRSGHYRVPDSVGIIGDNGFSELMHLTDVTIPDHVTNIEWHAFTSCTELTNINVGCGVVTLGDTDDGWLPFDGCPKLATIRVDPRNPAFTTIEGVLFNKERTKLIKCPGGMTGNYDVPAGVITIGSHAVSENPNLTAVVIPDSVTTIEDDAFEQDRRLMHVTIGKGVRSIGEREFAFCNSALVITVDPANPAYGSQNGTIIDKRKAALPRPVVSIQQPANGASIDAMWIDVRGKFTGSNVAQIFIQNGAANIEQPANINGRTFEARNVFLQPGQNRIDAVARDANGIAGTNTIIINGPASAAVRTAPVELQVTPGCGFTPLAAIFKVETHVPGKIEKIFYDFDGDGDADQTCSDLTPVSHTYKTSGEFFPVVTVETSIGRFSSLSGMVGQFAAAFGGGTPPPFVNVQAPPVVLSTIGIDDPVDVKWMANSNLYVLSGRTAAITEFDSGQKKIRSIKGIGTDPAGLDVDSGGNVYVAIAGDNEVKKFKPTAGSFTLDTSFGNGGSIGARNDSNRLSGPLDVKLSGDGQALIVSDAGHHRLRQFTLTGAAAGDENTSSDFEIPRGLANSDAGYFFIIDGGLDQVALTMGSMPVGVSGTNGTAMGQFNGSCHLAANHRALYVADTGNNRVQVFNRVQGGEMHSPIPFVPRVSISPELGLDHPKSVAAIDDPLEEKFYIADTGNNRVILVKLPLDNPEGVWKHMIGCLKAGDVQGALDDFSVESKDKYRQAYQSLSQDDLASLAKPMDIIKPAMVDSEHAQYYFESIVDGKTVTFPVEFDKELGRWKIMEF